MKSTATVLTLLTAAVLPSQAAWQRLPSLESRPVNMAVNAVDGTSIQSSSGIGQVSAFLSDDPLDAASIPVGISEVVVNAGTQAVFERVSIVNGGAEGKFAVSVSSDNAQFSPVGQAVFSPADSLVSISFAGIQGSYVKVQFEASRAGVIRHFQLFGGATDRDYEVTQSEDGTGGTTINAASGLGGARVIYAHPSPMGGSDNAVRYGSLAFPESDEKYRTVIYDLGQPRFLTEFGSVHSPRPVRLEVYAFSDLPETEDWRGRRAFDPAAFDTTTPVAAVEDSRGVGYVKVKPDQTVKARYVALRWEPDFNPPAFTTSGVYIGAGGIRQIAFNPGAGGGGGSGGRSRGRSRSGPIQGGTNPQWNGLSGPFAPNSLQGAGSGGLPAVPPPPPNQPGGNQGGGGPTPPIIVRPQPPQPPVVPPVSN